MCPRTFTEDSLDMVFGVNYVGPFYLTKLLTPLLKRSSPSRVVNVASGGYSSGRLNLEDLNGDRKKASSYDMWQTYCDSKLAVLLWTREMAKRNVPNIRCFAAHPGTVRTNIMRHWTGMSGLFLNTVSSLFFRSPEGGAQTIIDCAVRHDVDQHSGRYFEDCEMTEVTDAAADAQFAMRLWAKTESLVNSRLAGTRGGAGS
ncbi:PREDICTED: retinol dehydrogenase 14-like [Priapulus caudatus]|uniref:Retinol dehydrogenase 14-like n=1 Tax=Priapulus caudatus TaxID=37621 RepID=A0ABM1E385_PRICU|nr:PREDICTED: retinol dehydrogenase 14-like [Priapulus caudatus]